MLYDAITLPVAALRNKKVQLYSWGCVALLSVQVAEFINKRLSEIMKGCF